MKQKKQAALQRRSALTTTGVAWLATVSCVLAQVPGYTITTVAGAPGAPGGGPDSGLATTVSILPECLAFDATGNMYICDGARIRKVSTAGVMSTVAGGGAVSVNGLVGDGGPATSATLRAPQGIALDLSGNIYIADAAENRIRKVSTDGTITTIAGPGSTNGALGDGGLATSATLSSPSGIGVDTTGNIYIADTAHNRIRKISLDGTIITFAGNGGNSGAIGDGGAATKATIVSPTALATDSVGNVYVAEPGLNGTTGHSRIRRISPTGTISTVAGNGANVYSGDGGLATIAAVSLVSGMAVDGAGNLYIADSGNNRIRVVGTDGNINTIAGTGVPAQTGDNGPAISAGVSRPTGVAVGSDGKVYFPSAGPLSQSPGEDLCGCTVRLLTPSGTPFFPGPSIATNGVASASGWGQFSQLGLGSWVSIYGSYLAIDSRSWADSDFSGINAPAALDGTSVTIGGQPAFISYISPGQINAQVPTNIGMGAQPLVVTTGTGVSSTYAATVNPSEPGLLAPASFDIGGTQYVVALFQDGATYVLPSGAIPGVASRPAKAGDTIILYGIGFGTVVPTGPAGQIVQASNALTPPFQLFLGSTEAKVAYAGLAPGEVGLYQFNVTVPKLSTSGNVSLTFTLGGASSAQNLFVAIQ